MVTFSYPVYLVLALLLVLGFLVFSGLTKKWQIVLVGNFGHRQTLERFSRFAKKRLSVIILAIALVNLAAAAALPKFDSGQTPFSPTLNAIIVLDVSRSMLTEDGLAEESRLESGVVAIEKLFEAYPDGRFGLVLYTDRIVIYRPTFDHAAIRFLLRGILSDYAVRGEGSEPVKALGAAADLIEESSGLIDAVFLISDGGQSLDQSGPVRSDLVIDRLKKLGAEVVIVGVGGLVPAPIPVYENGEFMGYHRYQGTVVYSALEVTPLKYFAEQTNGRFIRLVDLGDLVKIARSENLDSQPVAAETSLSLVWLPVTIAMAFVALWLLHPRLTK